MKTSPTLASLRLISAFLAMAQQTAKPAHVFTSEEVEQEQPADMVKEVSRVAEAHGISGAHPLGPNLPSAWPCWPWDIVMRGVFGGHLLPQ
ncbi:MAG: hypothetical protein ABI680_07755 [Chthoniobacteraceae bacterium]